MYLLIYLSTISYPKTIVSFSGSTIISILSSNSSVMALCVIVPSILSPIVSYNFITPVIVLEATGKSPSNNIYSIPSKW